MRIQQALGAFLRTEAEQTMALVGHATYWIAAPQETELPYIAFRLASSRPMASGISRQYGPRESSVEIVAFAANQEAAVEIGSAVEADLVNFSGPMPAAGPSMEVELIELIAEEDLVSEKNLQDGVFAFGQTFQITHPKQTS